MPYIEGTKQKDQFGNPVTNQGGSNVLSQGTSTNTQQTNSKQPSSSGSWTNLNQYVNANQGDNQTAKQFGSSANKIVEGIKKVGSNINQNASNYSNNLKDYISRQGTVKSAITSPEKADVTKFNQALTGYQKPTDYSSTQYNTDINNANFNKTENLNKINQLKTAGGQDEFLSGINQAGSNYSQGSRALDRFLLNNTDEGKKEIEGLNKKSQEIGNMNFGGGYDLSGLESGVDQSLLTNQNVSDLLSSNINNTKDLMRYGVNNKGYDVNKIDYSNPNYSKLKALENLSGITSKIPLATQPVSTQKFRDNYDLNNIYTSEMNAAQGLDEAKIIQDKKDAIEKQKKENALLLAGYFGATNANLPDLVGTN